MLATDYYCMIDNIDNVYREGLLTSTSMISELYTNLNKAIETQKVRSAGNNFDSIVEELRKLVKNQGKTMIIPQLQSILDANRQ